MSTPPTSYVLVTGATGFIGAHVVDVLLARGMRVRGAARSMRKAAQIIEARPAYADQLDFVEIQDFENPSGLEAAVKDVDAIIHVASPFTYDTTDNEKELIIPAINGVKAMLEAATTNPKIRRVVITSSFAAVVDIDRVATSHFTYTAEDWNPLSYAEAASPSSSAVVAYRGSKKFAEKAAWDFMAERHPLNFDIVTLCPPMTFGPVVHPVADAESLNESNRGLWEIASGAARSLPLARVPFWIDVRDLATAHVEAALRPEVGGSRFTPASPEHWSYALAAQIIVDEFPDTADGVCREKQEVVMSHSLDGATAGRRLGFEYRPFRETVRDLVAQAFEMKKKTTT